LLAGLAFRSTIKMPQNPAFRIQTMGIGGFAALLGAVGLLFLISPGGLRIQGIFLFFIQVWAFLFFFICFCGAFPPIRFDQLMNFGWKFMVPTGIGVLILTAVAGVL